MNVENIKVAIVHDWLVTYGGAERVVETFLEMFPEAYIYTLVYDEKKMGKIFPKEKVRTSFIQKFPKSTKIYTKLLPLMPYAFEKFNLNKYDLVISSSSCCAKGVIVPPTTKHIAYIHSPMRYAWDLFHEYEKKSGFLTKVFMNIFMKNIRIWDVISSQRIDEIIANSNYIANRIKKYWQVNSKVIYPPVETERLEPNYKDSEEFYVSFSRFVSYKRIDLAIEACIKLDRKLIVIGDGEERKKLEKVAKNNENIIFTGRISDEEVKSYLQRCKALIFCAEEDFGIIPIECQACGRPVIAFGKGGALETILNKETGIFFEKQEVESLIESILEFEKLKFDTKAIYNHAQKFSKERFKKEILKYIDIFFRSRNENSDRL